MVQKSKKFCPLPHFSLACPIEDRVLGFNSQLAEKPKRNEMVQNGTEIEKVCPLQYSTIVRSIEGQVLRFNSHPAGEPKWNEMVQMVRKYKKTLEESYLEWPQMAHNGSENIRPYQLGPCRTDPLQMRGNERN